MADPFYIGCYYRLKWNWPQGADERHVIRVKRVLGTRDGVVLGHKWVLVEADQVEGDSSIFQGQFHIDPSAWEPISPKAVRK